MTKEQRALKGIYLNDIPSQKEYVSSTSVACEIDMQSVYKQVRKIAKRAIAQRETMYRFGAKNIRKTRKSLKIIAYNIQALKS